MFQQKEVDNTTTPFIEIITVNGSYSFTNSYIEQLKNAVNNEVVEIVMEYKNENAIAEISVDCLTFFDYGLEHFILSALAETLKSENVVFDGNATISLENNTIIVDSNVLNAVRNCNEITVIMSYFISKKLKKDKAEAITNIINCYHDICFLNFYENKIKIYDYFYSLTDEPLPVKNICKLFYEVSYVLSQFRKVEAIECKIEATDTK